jgi:serine protease AprX
LPGTEAAEEAQWLFDHRNAGDPVVEARIAEAKLVTPRYQHVDGTSFAAPLVAGVVACMLQANPALSPALVREVLIASARPVEGASVERQGAGAVDAGGAVAAALRELHGPLAAHIISPQVLPGGIIFLLHVHGARRVEVLGSWNNWQAPGLRALEVEPGVWQAHGPPLPSGRYTYKFLLDGTRWQDDPANAQKEPDSFGGLNSILVVWDSDDSPR